MNDLRKTLAKPEQKPMAWISDGGMRELLESGRTEVFRIQDYETIGTTPLYTTSQKREWVGLTDADKQEACGHMEKVKGGFWEFADYIEAKLKEKNT